MVYDAVSVGMIGCAPKDMLPLGMRFKLAGPVLTRMNLSFVTVAGLGNALSTTVVVSPPVVDVATIFMTLVLFAALAMK